MLHQRKSIRAKWDNYQNGSYFITICTKNRQHYFGSISDNKINLSEIVYKLNEIILNTIEIRKDQFIQIPIFTIMPNHLHLIIDLNTNFDISQHQFMYQTRNIPSIIRGIKCALTSYAIKRNIVFEWQPRYYDRIIRNEKEFSNIYEYIQNNVLNWDNDDLNC